MSIVELVRAVGGGATVFRGFTPYINLFSVNCHSILDFCSHFSQVKIDQAHVETVIPAIGKAVLMVQGAHRGCEAVLTELVEEKFCCSVRLETGKSAGKTLRSVPYEHISKLYVAS